MRFPHDAKKSENSVDSKQSISRAHHSASLRLALHPKNPTLRPVQLPDLG